MWQNQLYNYNNKNESHINSANWIALYMKNSIKFFYKEPTKMDNKNTPKQIWIGFDVIYTTLN